MRTRRTTELSEQCKRRWAGYAAAGAAGMGVLASGPSAKADIIFTPADVVLSPNSSFLIDFNHDGANELHLFDLKGGISTSGLVAASGIGNGNQVVIRSTQFRQASALLPGAKIGPSANFYRDGLLAYCYFGLFGGPWTSVENGFLGVKLSLNGQTYFGWAELTVTKAEGLNNVEATLEGYAYNNVPHAPILAGQGLPSPEPGTLGLLALGSLGLGYWRRRSQSAASAE